ncbi:hypothetical protein N7467_008564 [Penicillium canescens]|nr:hypothetical protein N7467_008564 [Penicillium canescens]
MTLHACRAILIKAWSRSQGSQNDSGCGDHPKIHEKEVNIQIKTLAIPDLRCDYLYRVPPVRYPIRYPMEAERLKP